MDTQTPRPMRADAVKNRARILEAARIEIELHGTDCSLDMIARRAGVGPGTLYRHFPTRDDLLSEILRGWVADVQADADGTRAHRWDDVLDWLERLAGHAMVYRGLAGTMAASDGEESSPLQSAHTAVLRANEQVFDRAIDSGIVSGPVDTKEVSRLVTGVAIITEQAHLDPEELRSMLAIILNGLTRPRVL
ncbi:TetR/AcrR family transcriptional regulator [Herbiconiux sp. P16]|uniref:TetR/AcrR family transcriptional regulator n=1 Tax=Herbiconiux wuyangfengii TaxID=3342794 RepID=UPI0035BA4684